MRVSNRMLYGQIVNSLNNSTEKMLKLNNQLSSGKRITRPGDDPVSMASVLIYRSEISGFDQSAKSIERTTNFLKRSESVLGSVDEQLARAVELATQQGSATASADTRLGAAEELRQILETVTGLANSKYGNKYIFGGTNTQTDPFQNLSASKLAADVGQVSATAPAVGASGARYLNTTDNTIYQSDGASWVSQGVPVEGTAVKNTADGQYYVYSSANGWQPHYQGNSDSFGIKISKTDTVEANIPGDRAFLNSAGNVFETLIELERALRNNDQSAIQAALPDLEDASVVINNNLAVIGARINRLEYVDTVNDSATVDTKATKSALEDVDYAEALTDLTNQETIYQAALKSASLITQMSLADYI